MRILYTLVLLMAMSFTAYSQVENHSLAQGSGYANDVFYSFKNGEIKTVERATWDLAFSTKAFSASILVNHGSGAMLWVHPAADTTSWSQPMDTMGLSSWLPIYNSDTSWEEGAFNAPATGHPDYGWCLYNMLDHNLYGHRLFILKTVGGDFKKVWIKKKRSAAVEYDIVVSDIDHSNEEPLAIEAALQGDKNFVYYSFTTNGEVDYEPASDSWDLVFSRYYDLEIPYYVVGVLQNENTFVAEVGGVDSQFSDTTGLLYSDVIKTIGSDWKSFDMGSMAWTIASDVVYFVRTQNGELYRLGFSNFEGSSTGVSHFWTEALELVGMESFSSNDKALQVYPNPSQGEIFVNLSGIDLSKDTRLQIVSSLGQVVYSESIPLATGLSTINLPSNIPAGIYFIRLEDKNSILSKKLIIN